LWEKKGEGGKRPKETDTVPLGIRRQDHFVPDRKRKKRDSMVGLRVSHWKSPQRSNPAFFRREDKKFLLKSKRAGLLTKDSSMVPVHERKALPVGRKVV